jgi:hypothetical protein
VINLGENVRCVQSRSIRKIFEGLKRIKNPFLFSIDEFSVRGIISRCLKAGDWISFRLMCRERGSVLFYPRKSFNHIISKNESERLSVEINTPKYAHLLSADGQAILNEIIEKEKFELLNQLEQDGDQPEACFIKQALEENNVKF